ncbi:MAG: hypothetical protein ACO4AU_05810 [bacterium]|jgi:hypothetical protein
MEAILTRLVTQLEFLAGNGVSLPQGLDLLEASAKNCSELIVINVLRDALRETVREQVRWA